MSKGPFGLQGLPLVNDYSLKIGNDGKDHYCDVCNKPTNTFLLTSNNSDFFWICKNHVYDYSFCKETTGIAWKEPKNPIEKTEGDKKDEKNVKNVKVEDNEKNSKKEYDFSKAKFQLNSSIHYLRINHHKQKTNSKEASQVMKQLPSVPK